MPEEYAPVEKLILINYYSKVKNGFGIDKDLFERNMKYNQNRVVSKLVKNSDVRFKHKMLVNLVEFSDEITRTHTKLRLIPNENNTGTDLEAAPLYRTFKIPKRRGGFREINAPCADLEDVQKKLNRMILKKLKYLPANAVHGFTKHRNCKTALETHVRKHSRWFLKLDIEDFFTNTTADKIYEALSSTYPFSHLDDIFIARLIQIACIRNRLPQGSPLSPTLTNIVMGKFDVKITEECKKRGLVYTRYADDILISSPYKFDTEEIISVVSGCARDNGYTLKESKTRFGSYNGRNWNLGLMINNQGRITVGHKKKQEVKAWLHNYITDPEQHTDENYNTLLGVIGYCKYIEPDYFEPYLQKLKDNK